MGTKPYVALLIALLLVVPAATASGALVAQSMWGAKAGVDAHKLWWLERAPWQERVTGAGVRVAVIDTGIDTSHPDLAGSVVAWRDLVGDRTGVKRDRPYDDHGHGTHVAGLIAARGHFQWNPLKYYWISGMRGIAPQADLIVAKAITHLGVGSDDVVAQAILWSMDPNSDGDIEDGADVINLSIGVEKPNTFGSPNAFIVGSETKRAIQLALARGIVVVVSSGNEGSSAVAEPGDIQNVLSVGAVDRDGRVAPFSNGGLNLDLVAPGVLVSAYPVALDGSDFAQDGYVGMAGTSMAAPVVAGIVALMMDADPRLRERSTTENLNGKVEHVARILKATATPVPGADEERAGAGLVNARLAVAAVDQGTDELHFGMIAAMGGGILLVGYVAVRPRFRRQDDARRPAEAVPGSGEGHD